MVLRTIKCGECQEIIKTASKGKNFIHCRMLQDISENELGKSKKEISPDISKNPEINKEESKINSETEIESEKSEVSTNPETETKEENEDWGFENNDEEKGKNKLNPLVKIVLSGLAVYGLTQSKFFKESDFGQRATGIFQRLKQRV